MPAAVAVSGASLLAPSAPRPLSFPIFAQSPVVTVSIGYGAFVLLTRSREVLTLSSAPPAKIRRLTKDGKYRESHVKGYAMFKVGFGILGFLLLIWLNCMAAACLAPHLAAAPLVGAARPSIAPLVVATFSLGWYRTVRGVRDRRRSCELSSPNLRKLCIM